ncbi:unnamed protein product [Paramecium octaurelia]|uniref:Uncharacterized protein n=1 Tax=Paramecium octaurelia TaxID=43137 RepID=A0A8S1WRQ6_PAROT|nr:unnamed protein product [Paramecium octaurelia]
MRKNAIQITESIIQQQQQQRINLIQPKIIKFKFHKAQVNLQQHLRKIVQLDVKNQQKYMNLRRSVATLISTLNLGEHLIFYVKIQDILLWSKNNNNQWSLSQTLKKHNE